jgi:hypothetical protein
MGFQVSINFYFSREKQKQVAHPALKGVII